MKSDLERKAFQLGYSFRLGLMYGRQLALDEELKFRTLENGTTIAIKDDEVVGGAGSAVGPDKLPTFEWFMRGRTGEGRASMVRSYAAIHLKSIIESLRYPKGMPPDCERIHMGPKQIRELAGHMNHDKEKVLPYIADAYRKGKYRQARDTKHDDIESVIYTTADIDVGSETYEVELISKKRKLATGGGYIQYGIGKADKKKGAADSDTCSHRRAAVGPLPEDSVPPAGRGVYEIDSFFVRKLASHV